jgi:hypothetical protein
MAQPPPSLPIVAFDESGNTGENLLDQLQPIYCLASVHIDESKAEALAKDLLLKGQKELRFASLRGSRRGREAIVAALTSWCVIVLDHEPADTFFPPIAVLDERWDRGVKRRNCASVIASVADGPTDVCDVDDVEELAHVEHPRRDPTGIESPQEGADALIGRVTCHGDVRGQQAFPAIGAARDRPAAIEEVREREVPSVVIELDSALVELRLD